MVFAAGSPMTCATNASVIFCNISVNFMSQTLQFEKGELLHLKVILHTEHDSLHHYRYQLINMVGIILLFKYWLEVGVLIP